MKRRGWSFTEEKVLIDNYNKCTIKELEMMFPERSRESINNKIKRLKAAGKIAEGKTDDTVQRAYEQRGEQSFMTVEDLHIR
jgi:hypothetical protein